MDLYIILLFSALLWGCKSQSCTQEGALRLVNGQTIYEGRVEVCRGSKWGTVCDDLWDSSDASVVCAQLGYSRQGAVAHFNAHFGRGGNNVPIHMDNVRCNGTEQWLVNCSHLSNHNCFHGEDAGVTCLPLSSCENGELRLEDGTNEGEGRVEVCVNGKWGTVCDDNWDATDASVVCRQLGFSRHNATSLGLAWFGQGRGLNILLDEVQCTGSERRLIDCPYDSRTANCFHFEDASVRCNTTIVCQEGELRLAGGNVSSEGRVEICFNETWGTVCDDHWDSVDAGVVCQQLGYGATGALSLSSQVYGAGGGPINMDNVACTGRETTLAQCPYDSHTSDCSHAEDAGVRCTPLCTEGDVRLVGTGSNSTQGRVEICLNQVWGTVCDDRWDNTDAGVVCSQLGHSRNDAIGVGSARFGQGAADMPIHLDEVSCTGVESTLLECGRRPHDCRHFEDAGVICNEIISVCTEDEVRLVGTGSNSTQGRVEICLNQVWGTVCDDSWDNTDAGVACSQLGYSRYNAIGVGLARFGQGAADMPIHLDDVSCTGGESTLLECGRSPHNCLHYEDAGVICNETLRCTNGDIRLSGGSHSSEGRVEVCWNETWGTVCDNSWNTADAQVACKQLGFTGHSVVLYLNAHFGQGTGPILLDQLSCTGSERRLVDCSHSGINNTAATCGHDDDAGVKCSPPLCANGDIRLVNGLSPYEGRVEVCWNDAWGTVCDDGWGQADARVVCRQLGFLTTTLQVLSYSQAHFGRGQGKILLDDVDCDGVETNLTSCDRLGGNRIEDHNCFHGEDAGARCAQCTENSVRLVNGSASYEGRVEVCLGGGWGTVCADGWDSVDAAVVCRQLGFHSQNVMTFSSSVYGEGTTDQPIALSNVACTSTDTQLTQCTHSNASRITSCNHSMDVGMTCSTPVPGAPQNLQVIVTGSRSVTLTWFHPPESQRYSTIDNYFINCSTTSSGYPDHTMETLGNDSLSVSVTGLHPYTFYSCCVSAESDVGRGDPLCQTARTLADVPTRPPKNIYGSATGSRSAQVFWSDPDEEHRNGPINDYYVDVYEVNTGTVFATYIVTDTRIGITALHPFYDYNFTIAAYTVGKGPYSSGLVIRTYQDVPSGSPQSVSIVPSATNITVIIEDPLPEHQNGIIISYIVILRQASNGATTQITSTSSTVTFHSVTPYTDYFINAQASTVNGTGPSSVSYQVTTLEAAPSRAPRTIRHVTHNTTTLTLSWRAPARSYHNGVLRGYKVNLTEVISGTLMHLDTATTSIAIPLLRPYYVYEYTVAAYTVSVGPYSSVNRVQMPEDVPSAPPQDVSVNITSETRASLTWTPPTTEHQNGVIRSYIVRLTNEITRVNNDVTTTSTSYQLTSLLPNTLYSVMVAASTSVGVGPFSESIALETGATRPSASPTLFTVTVQGSRSLRLSWAPPPEGDRNGEIQGYSVEVEEVETGTTLRHRTGQSVTSYNATMLHPYYNYNSKVAAYNSAGSGPFTGVVSRQTLQDVPTDYPRNIMVTVSSPYSVTIEWDPLPSEHRNGIITNYVVNVSVNEENSSLDDQYSVDSTSFELQTQPYTTYMVTVAAATVRGQGPFSTEEIVTTPEDSPTHVPQNITEVILGPRSFLLTWEAPPLEHHNGEIRHYRINVTEVETGTRLSYTTEDTQVTIMDLHPYYRYVCTVTAVTVSEGPYSANITARTHEDAPSTAPPRVTCEAVSSTVIRMRWNNLTPSSRNGLIRGYSTVLTDAVSGEQTTQNTSVRLATFSNLVPFRTYRCKVAALTVALGPFSTERQVTTHIDAPSSSPQSFTAIPRSPTVLHTTWSPPPVEDQNGPLLGYVVQLTEITSRTTWTNFTNGTAFQWRSLHPHYTYQSRVAARTQAGTGPYTPNTTVSMPQAAPTGAPQGLVSDVRSPRVVHISWEPPPEEEQNGVINQYRLSVRENSTGREWSLIAITTEHLLDFLHPYYLYSVKVAAYTVGVGVYSEPLGFTTHEDVPGSPINLAVEAVSSRSIHLSWEPPPLDQRNGIIQRYSVNITTLSDQRSVFSILTNSTSYTVPSLHPYFSYSCSVAAETGAGRGSYITKTIRLPEDAPESAPENFNGVATSPRSLQLFWSPPPISEQNGIVRSYTINTTEVETGRVQGFIVMNTTIVLTDLHAYYQYICTVAAYTVALGPTARITLRTLEDAPSGAPLGLSVVHNFATTADLSWFPLPLDQQNGVITGYEVTVDGPGPTRTISLTDASTTSTVVTGLRPFSPYTFNVSAVTSVGSGPPASVSSTTPQGVPANPPSIGSVRRITPSSIEVSWEPLPQEEVVGVVTAYLVKYRIVPEEELSRRRSRRNSDNLTTVVETNDTSIVVGDLDLRNYYALSVAVRTGAGLGGYSPETVVGLYENSFFQLHMSGTISCSLWLSSDSFKKSSDVIKHVTDPLENNCNCDLSAKHVTNDRLMCGDGSTDRVIFVGRLIGTERAGSDKVLDQLQEWVESEPTILVQGVQLKLTPCVVELREGEEPKCIPLHPPSPVTEGVSGESRSEGSGLPIFVGSGVAVGAFLLLICVTVTLIIIIVAMRRKQKRTTTIARTDLQHYTLEPRDGIPVTNTDTRSKAESEKLKESELETDLDSKLHFYDDSHIYDEPSQYAQKAREPLPLPPDYKNIRSHSDDPPSYSSTVRFLQSAPLPSTPMLDSFLSNGTANVQNETSNYSELDTNTMSRLEYGNIGRQSTVSVEGSAAYQDVRVGAIDYTNIVSRPAEPNPYAELPGTTPSAVTSAPSDDPADTYDDVKVDVTAAVLAINGRPPHIYETPVKRQSDYQPLLPGPRATSGEYAQASPHHPRTVYDVPRRQSEDIGVQSSEQIPQMAVAVGSGGDGVDKEEYVNTTAQAMNDMQEYVEMSSASKE